MVTTSEKIPGTLNIQTKEEMKSEIEVFNFLRKRAERSETDEFTIGEGVT